MTLPNGSQPLEGWTVRFPVKEAENAETYRIADDGGALAFLKVFHPERIGADSFASDGRLLEIAIMESLEHPSIPPIQQSGVFADGRPYFIADLVPGETLDHRLARVVAVSPQAAASIMQGLCEAVSYLHELPDPVVHGELTPSNVVLDPGEHDDDRPVLIDFGHARRKSDGAAANPPAIDPYYLPNECYEVPVASQTADVFALGAIFYRLLFGLPPWFVDRSSSGQVDLRRSVLRARMEPLRLPVRADGGHPDDTALSVIKKALSTRPEDRFDNARSLAEALTESARTKVRNPTPHPAPVPVGRRRGFDAVAGMDDLKQTLIRDVIEPLRDRERARRYGVPIPNGLLLYGPPGCGKTFIAKRFGEETGLAFREVVPSDVASPYIHGTQERIRLLFDEARQNKPCILFLDEVDALMPSRDGSLHASYAGEVAEWLAQMNECGRQEIFLLAATNEPMRMDVAVRRSGRFDRIVYVGPPDCEARTAIFELHLRDRPVADDVACDELAQRTTGRVASDISFLVNEAARAAFTSRADVITMEHILSAIRMNGLSVGGDQLRRYERMRGELSPSKSGDGNRRTIGFDHRRGRSE